MITKISDLPKKVNEQPEKISSLLFIVIIESIIDFHAFSNVSNYYNNNNNHRTVVIFTNEMDECHNPIGNPFNLVFNSRMIVKCYNFPILREWYSIDSNTTITNDLFLWDGDISELIALTSPNLYERRNSLAGITLRVAALKVIFYKY